MCKNNCPFKKVSKYMTPKMLVSLYEKEWNLADNKTCILKHPHTNLERMQFIKSSYILHLMVNITIYRFLSE